MSCVLVERLFFTTELIGTSPYIDLYFLHSLPSLCLVGKAMSSSCAVVCLVLLFSSWLSLLLLIVTGGRRFLAVISSQHGFFHFVLFGCSATMRFVVFSTRVVLVVASPWVVEFTRRVTASCRDADWHVAVGRRAFSSPPTAFRSTLVTIQYDRGCVFPCYLC